MKIKDIFWNSRLNMITHVSFFLLICSVIFIGLLTADRYTAYVCESHQKITGKESEHMFLDSCYVKHNGEWLRYSDYQKIIIAREGLK